MATGDEMAVDHSWAFNEDADTGLIRESVLLTFVAHRDDKDEPYNALCLDLGVPAFADTLDEAFARAQEATLCYLNALERNGTREAVFSQHGVRTEGGSQSALSVTMDLDGVYSAKKLVLIA